MANVFFNGERMNTVILNGKEVYTFARFPEVTSSVMPVTDGDYLVYTFNGVGNFTVDQEGNAGGSNTYQLLLVGGGGQVGLAGAGFGGGAGAGGMVEVAAQALPQGSYDIVVGNGPNMGSNDDSFNGGDSKIGSISALTAFGGGARSSGGSGAGGSGAGAGSSGVAGQGNAGGSTVLVSGDEGAETYYTGGGGGAGGPGGNATNTAGGAGGPGKSSDISGTSVCYAGGGAGYQRTDNNRGLWWW